MTDRNSQSDDTLMEALSALPISTVTSVNRYGTPRLVVAGVGRCVCDNCRRHWGAVLDGHVAITPDRRIDEDRPLASDHK